MNKIIFTALLILPQFWSIGQNIHTVLITYYSKSGNTATLAKAIEKGANLVKGIHVVTKTIDQISQQDLLMADAIILGSPVHNGNPSYEVLKFIETWPFEGAPLKNKIGAAFATAGGISAGEELVQLGILHAMMVYGMIVIGGDDWTAPFGASAITNEAPFNKGLNSPFLIKGELLGKRVAEVVVRWNQQ